MLRISRVDIRKSIEIAASADEVWELITDWAGMLSWWLTAEEGGLHGPTLVDCELVGEPQAVPRTRRMILANGSVIEEELFYQDDTTRRIYYTKSADPDVTGYVASTYVDELDGRACLVHISSRFDVRPYRDADAAATRFETIYETMFDGYKRHFASTDPS
jgi:hypothetical protein